MDWNKKLNEDVFIFSGIFLVLAGVGLSAAALFYWKNTGFSKLVPEIAMRIAIPAVTLMQIGIQLIFSGFMVGILKINFRGVNRNE